MTTPVTVPVEPLWMMHVIGPDDIYPAPDHATAVEWCAYLNSEIAPKVPGVLCVAVPAIWTGAAEEHAEGMPEAIRGWSLPPAAPAPEGVAVDALREALIQADLKIRSLPGTDQSDVEFIREALATREEVPAEAGVVTADSLRSVSDETVRALLSCKDVGSGRAHLASIINALRAQPPAREDAQPVWVDGVPTKHHAKEWFIAETTFGDRVVLTALPEEYNYDFKTADETYIKADCIKRWMPFPDSQYRFPCPAPAPDALRVAVEAWAELAKRTGWEVSFSGFDEEDGWSVHRVTGGVNDREWEELSRAETPLEAILAALQAEQGAK